MEMLPPQAGSERRKTRRERARESARLAEGSFSCIPNQKDTAHGKALSSWRGCRLHTLVTQQLLQRSTEPSPDTTAQKITAAPFGKLPACG